MLITFRTYSKILDQWFVQEKIVDKMSDFALYAKALYSGNYEIIKIEKIKEDKN